MSDTKVFGPSENKLEPKLRMVANGKSEVNQQRASQCGALAVKTVTGRAARRQMRALHQSLS